MKRKAAVRSRPAAGRKAGAPDPKAKATPKAKAPSRELRARAERILELLAAEYPDAHCELDHEGPWQLLVATILSAQCTDKRVNMVTPGLFARYPGPRELGSAAPEEVEDLVRTTGFFRNKAKHIRGASRAIVEDHGGEVPQTMEELVRLPGVARKTANCVLSTAFGKNEGVVVDTHVLRLSRLLGLTRARDPRRVEADLARLFPRASWGILSHYLIWHGRRVCIARRPRCGDCVLARWCPSARGQGPSVAC